MSVALSKSQKSRIRGSIIHQRNCSSYQSQMQKDSVAPAYESPQCGTPEPFVKSENCMICGHNRLASFSLVLQRLIPESKDTYSSAQELPPSCTSHGVCQVRSYHRYKPCRKSFSQCQPHEDSRKPNGRTPDFQSQVALPRKIHLNATSVALMPEDISHSSRQTITLLP